MIEEVDAYGSSNNESSNAKPYHAMLCRLNLCNVIQARKTNLNEKTAQFLSTTSPRHDQRPQ